MTPEQILAAASMSDEKIIEAFVEDTEAMLDAVDRGLPSVLTKCFIQALKNESEYLTGDD